jgi:hypothetical protein
MGRGVRYKDPDGASFLRGKIFVIVSVFRTSSWS